MPICTVDRKRLGSAASASARLAPLRPSWARALRRDRRDETTASSESAKSPLRAMRTSTTAISNTAMRPVHWLPDLSSRFTWSGFVCVLERRLEVRPRPSLRPDALSFHVSVSRARRGRISPRDGNTRAECARSRLAWRDRRRYHREQPACARSFDGNSHSLRWPPSLGMLPAMWRRQSRPFIGLGRIACRRCFRLRYLSQSMDQSDRALHAMATSPGKIDPEAAEMDFPAKPPHALEPVQSPCCSTIILALADVKAGGW